MPDSDAVHAAAASVRARVLTERLAASDEAYVKVLSSVTISPCVVDIKICPALGCQIIKALMPQFCPAGRRAEWLAICDARLRGSRSAAAGCAVSGALRLPLRTCVRVSGNALHWHVAWFPSRVTRSAS